MKEFEELLKNFKEPTVRIGNNVAISPYIVFGEIEKREGKEPIYRLLTLNLKTTHCQTEVVERFFRRGLKILKWNLDLVSNKQAKGEGLSSKSEMEGHINFLLGLGVEKVRELENEKLALERKIEELEKEKQESLSETSKKDKK